MTSLKKLVTEVTENDNNLRDIVFDIVVKIIDLPDKTTTSIAKLIDYKPEVFFVEPLMQGKVNRYVRLVCKKIEIHLETLDDKKLVDWLILMSLQNINQVNKR